jgi:hypothetical protein
LGEVYRRRAGRAGASALLASSLALFVAPPADTQDMTQRLEWETLANRKPAWLFGARASLGWDLEREEAYPGLGVQFGYIGVEHLFVGGTIDSRVTAPHYLRLGLRLGVLFTRAEFAWGFGVSPGLLAIPSPAEAGMSITWGAMARLRLSGPHYLTAHLEADLLYEVLGFRDDRAFLNGGLGWAIVF